MALIGPDAMRAFWSALGSAAGGIAGASPLGSIPRRPDRTIVRFPRRATWTRTGGRTWLVEFPSAPNRIEAPFLLSRIEEG